MQPASLPAQANVRQGEREEWFRRLVRDGGRLVWNPNQDPQVCGRLVRGVDPNVRRVLVPGCGLDVSLQRRLLEDLPLCEVVSADLVPEVAREARSSLASPRASFLCGDNAALPFPDGSFDLVLASNCVFSSSHELNRRALAEFFRVLRSGAELRGVFPSVFASHELAALGCGVFAGPGLLLDLEGCLFSEGVGHLQRRFYSPLRLDLLLREAGFERASFEILFFDTPVAKAESERVYGIPRESGLCLWEMLVTYRKP